MPEGTLRVDVITHLPAVLREVGLDPDAIIAASGLEPNVFDDPQNLVPIRRLGRLLALATAASGCDHIGLLVGERAATRSAGLIGALVRHSPDAWTALHNLVTHMPLRSRGAVAPFEVSNGVVTIGYEVYETDVEGADQICDGALAVGTTIVRALCGPSWRPDEVRFAHRRPRDEAPFQRVFDAPLRFDAERTALVFAAKWLSRPTPGADPQRYRELAKTVAELEARAGGDVVAELRRLLRVLLLAGHGSSDEVVRELSIHRRTLNRRLQARGTNFRKLLGTTRFELARQLLENTSMPLGEIAETLGYADSSGFTRAFRRWTGVAPSTWRKEPGSGAAAHEGGAEGAARS